MDAVALADMSVITADVPEVEGLDALARDDER